jgi:hypothetical protein
MFADLKCGQAKFLHRIFRIKGQLCYISASKVKDKDGKTELQIFIAFNMPQNAQEAYRERWQVETLFRGIKSSGFNIEDTHLRDMDRIEKLLTLVMLAFTWAYIVGVFIDDNIKPIRILKHGRRAKSFFKYGLEYIANIFLNPLSISEIDVFKFLSCT